MATAALSRSAEVVLLSSVPGRQRWRVPAIESQPRLAAAIEIAFKKQSSAAQVKANPVTGTILIRWYSTDAAVEAMGIISRAIEAGPLNEAAYLKLRGAPDGKARTLVSKLWLGGFKLGAILLSRLAWGSVAAGPLAAPILVISVSGTIITGFDFLRAVFQTMTGRGKITTGTLIGAATISSIALKETVTALIVIWLLNLGEYLEALTLRRTRAAIRDLLASDEDIWVVVGDVEVSRRPDQVRHGDLVVARAGHKISVDGVIDFGQGTVNEAPITVLHNLSTLLVVFNSSRLIRCNPAGLISAGENGAV